MSQRIFSDTLSPLPASQRGSNAPPSPGGVREQNDDRRFFSVPCAVSHFLSRVNAQWEIHGFPSHYNTHYRVNSLIHHLCP